MGVTASEGGGGCRRGISPEGGVSGVLPKSCAAVLTSSCFTGAAPAVMANAVKMARNEILILSLMLLYVYGCFHLEVRCGEVSSSAVNI